MLRNIIRKWLGINELEINSYSRLETIENLILHQESKYSGFAVLKKHLQRPDKPLMRYMGKPIKQD